MAPQIMRSFSLSLSLSLSLTLRMAFISDLCRGHILVHIIVFCVMQRRSYVRIGHGQLSTRFSRYLETKSNTSESIRRNDREYI